MPVQSEISRLVEFLRANSDSAGFATAIFTHP